LLLLDVVHYKIFFTSLDAATREQVI